MQLIITRYYPLKILFMHLQCNTFQISCAFHPLFLLGFSPAIYITLTILSKYCSSLVFTSENIYHFLPLRLVQEFLFPSLFLFFLFLRFTEASKWK